ncbi:hypothetical protein F4556_000190 [Kitasatospora gansuensis]|uniref:Uncharacterized protein n=1 Tax=Kitasatospora gansuensis TaxID=258050 RepID=A0A7W7WFL2_9ACTN|nr:hypothetical protein [Kitasatospora gansuensis]MBB4944655.1 hypothetical protein [Kitasatospora gansuensis]
MAPHPHPRSAAPGGLRISRVLAQEFDGRSETSLDPDLRVFAGDLARPYGLPLREDLLDQGVGHAYGEMGEVLIDRLALTEDQSVDLLILAFAVPDVQPGRAVTLHLARRCPGRPLAFAIGDQGSAAPFTALRIADQYARTGACRRALVLILEQSTLHYRPAGPVTLPKRHQGVLLLLEPAVEGGEMAIRQFSEPPEGDRPPSHPDQPLTGCWAGLAGGAGPVRVTDLDEQFGRWSALDQPAAG